MKTICILFAVAALALVGCRSDDDYHHNGYDNGYHHDGPPPYNSPGSSQFNGMPGTGGGMNNAPSSAPVP